MTGNDDILGQLDETISRMEAMYERLYNAVQYVADHCPNDEIRHRAIDALAACDAPGYSRQDA